jgi:hypothetical protein
LFLSEIMSDNAIGAPSRELDEFEQLVYEYAGRMGVGSEGVSTMCSIETYELHLPSTHSYYA